MSVVERAKRGLQTHDERIARGLQRLSRVYLAVYAFAFAAIVLMTTVGLLSIHAESFTDAQTQTFANMYNALFLGLLLTIFAFYFDRLGQAYLQSGVEDPPTAGDSHPDDPQFVVAGTFPDGTPVYKRREEVEEADAE